MKVIGICGSTGSGKSTLCRILSGLGYPILDCDKIYHNLINAPSECLSEICRTFGDHLQMDGVLNRKELGKIVFSSPEKLTLLNKISHHFVVLEIKKELEKLKNTDVTHCFIDAPMLYEAGLEKICDTVCAVISQREAQIDRVCQRDHILKEEAEKRISNQTSPEVLREKADFVIENTGSLNEFESHCYDFIKKIELMKG